MKQLKQLQRKVKKKKLWGFNGIQTHDLCDTSVMLYQLSYEASLSLLCIHNTLSWLKFISLLEIKEDLNQFHMT